jgi:hypothetical protein
MSSKNKEDSATSTCPECGKKIPGKFIHRDGSPDTQFCSRMCEVNFKYRMTQFDPKTGKLPRWQDIRGL